MANLNVTPEYLYTNTWGYWDVKTNRINGMFGDLIDKYAHIGGTAGFMLPDRISKFEYLSTVTPTKAKFIFRAPPLSNVANIYYMPFKSNVWIVSGCMVFVACLVIYWAVNRDRRDSDEKNARFSDIALLGIGAICQMGSAIETRHLSTKISTIFFFIFLLFMYTSYTANIVSLLQATTKSIRTLEDLYNSKFDYGVENTSYNRFYFEHSTGAIHRAIYERKIAPPNQKPKFVNGSYGISRMREVRIYFFY